MTEASRNFFLHLALLAEFSAEEAKAGRKPFILQSHDAVPGLISLNNASKRTPVEYKKRKREDKDMVRLH